MKLEGKSKEELLQIAEAVKILSDKNLYDKQSMLFPEGGKFPRHLYWKALEFFKAGYRYKERAIIAGNRTGKTYNATAEVSWHLNGKYPEWWEGKVFKGPIKCWMAGKTHETTKDILQQYMLGEKYDLGSGMIPKADIVGQPTSKPGVPGAYQDVYVKHYTNGVEDGLSHLVFKSYVQGVEAFMGAQVHLIALDEEPDDTNIYTECLTRTMTTKGIVICTFTPLNGLSDTVLSFIPDGKFPENGYGEV